MNNDPNEPMKGLSEEEREALQVTCPECGLTEWASVEIWRPSFSMGKVRCPNCGFAFHDRNLPIADIQAARHASMAPPRSSVFEPEVPRLDSPLEGAILSAVSRGFTPGPGQTEPIPFTCRVGSPKELGLEEVTYPTTIPSFSQGSARNTEPTSDNRDMKKKGA